MNLRYETVYGITIFQFSSVIRQWLLDNLRPVPLKQGFLTLDPLIEVYLSIDLHRWLPNSNSCLFYRLKIILFSH